MKNSEKDGALTKDEEMNENGVPWSTYGSFVSAGGVLLFVLVVLAQLGGQVLSIYASFWLTNWGANTRKFQSTYLQDMPLSRSLYWYNGYAGTLMASVALVTFRFVCSHSSFAFSLLFTDLFLISFRQSHVADDSPHDRRSQNSCVSPAEGDVLSNVFLRRDSDWASDQPLLARHVNSG